MILLCSYPLDSLKAWSRPHQKYGENLQQIVETGDGLFASAAASCKAI